MKTGLDRSIWSDKTGAKQPAIYPLVDCQGLYGGDMENIDGARAAFGKVREFADAHHD